MEPSALQTVIQTPELRELIFIHLPLRDLLINVQRVSRSWYQSTQAPSLQRYLFFAQWPQEKFHNRSQVNPLLKARFRAFFGPRMDPMYGKETWDADGGLVDTAWNRDHRSVEAFSRADASWRKMLVVQPPVTRIEIFESVSQRGGPRSTKGSVAVGDGLRMGTLYDLVQGKVCSGSTRTNTWFRVYWSMIDSNAGDTRFSVRGPREWKQTIVLQLQKFRSCVERKRNDFTMPVFTGNETEAERDCALRHAMYSNDRPQLKSMAYAPVDIQWEESQM